MACFMRCLMTIADITADRPDSVRFLLHRILSSYAEVSGDESVHFAGRPRVLVSRKNPIVQR